MKIIKWFEVEEEAYEFEVELSKRRKQEGFNIVGMTGFESGFKGKTHTEETRYLFSKLKKGKSLSEDHAENIRISLIKYYENNPGTMKGKNHSEEARRKMSESHADFSGENNPMYGRRGKDNPTSKEVYVFKNNKLIYKCSCTREASEITGVKSVKEYARGICKHYHKKSGYHFYYESNLPEDISYT